MYVPAARSDCSGRNAGATATRTPRVIVTDPIDLDDDSGIACWYNARRPGVPDQTVPWRCAGTPRYSGVSRVPPPADGGPTPAAHPDRGAIGPALLRSADRGRGGADRRRRLAPR